MLVPTLSNFVENLFQILGHYMAPDIQDPDVPDAQDVRNALTDVMEDLQVIKITSNCRFLLIIFHQIVLYLLI